MSYSLPQIYATGTHYEIGLQIVRLEDYRHSPLNTRKSIINRF
jgi:hypothetical protein